MSTSRRERWLTRGLESLLEEQSRKAEVFDVLIIGSGYGGAVAAHRLCELNAQQGFPWRIAMLERGREYLPGSFPGTEAELPGHLRFTTPHGDSASGRLEGLFDFRMGKDVSVVLANGVGGGSLINAGVMAAPSDEVWLDHAWPASRRDAAAFNGHAAKMRDLLQATPLPATDRPRRHGTMASLGGRAVPITVATKDVPQTHAGVKLTPCVQCGDCATGCNHGAKISLDVGLLKQARDNGLQIYTGATVSRLQRSRDKTSAAVWEAEVWHTDMALRKRMESGALIGARRVVLAAGALGSTDILLRSQTATLPFSARLGHGFSANGDILAAVHDSQSPQDSVADEEQLPDQRHVGPTITSMIDWRDAGAKPSMVVQDLGVPGALSRLFGEGLTTAALLHSLDHADKSDHHPGDEQTDPCSVDDARMQRSLALAMIVRDDAGGVMSPAPDNINFPCDAGIRIDWPQARHDKRLDQAHAAMSKALQDNPSGKEVGGRLLPNPMWRLLPPGVSKTLNVQPGPTVTVHPLGGCPMAQDRLQGVVDAQGRVFNGMRQAGDTEVLPGLLVLDGAMVPTSLGINPALTIATLADMAVQELMADAASGWAIPAADHTKPSAPAPVPLARERPRHAPESTPVRRAETKVQVIERLSGQVDMQVGGQSLQGLRMELDVVYKPRALFPRQQDGSRAPFKLSGHTLSADVDPELSCVRVYRLAERPRGDQTAPPDEVLFAAPLAAGGKLHFLHREQSTFSERRCRAWRAWLANRGARDTAQALAAMLRRWTGQDPDSTETLNPFERCRQSKALASRAGEVRLFDYALPLDAPTTAKEAFAALATRKDLVIKGSKRLAYERRSNPITQLSRLNLDEGDASAPLRFGPRRSLDLCPRYLATKGMPLLRVVEQHDQPTALLDTLSFLLFLARVLINVHLWSFRKPDTALRRTPRRLPDKVPGLPDPEVHQWVPDGAQHGQIRLTHYPLGKARKEGRVVLMIHGYSASGTTFAHPAVNPNLAATLHRQGYEPWIVDLRTSCGMPTADQPWTFEEIALADIPAAIREVCAQTGLHQIHVITHCMGSAMMSLLLQSREASAAATARKLRSWTMSQFGPRMRFSPGNVFRAYVASWLRHAIPRFRYELRPGSDVPGVDANLYDRFIAAIPYLDDELGSEFDRENPSPWTFWRTTPWVGTRHRLDALIGRTFDARNMRDETLNHIDDFFGPINLRTISQPIHFANFERAVLDRGREAQDVDASAWLAKVPMLSLHGKTNGLADPVTADALRAWRDIYGLDLQVLDKFDDYGHQDLLIGKDCTPVFDAIVSFLNRH